MSGQKRGAAWRLRPGLRGYLLSGHSASTPGTTGTSSRLMIRESYYVDELQETPSSSVDRQW